MIKEIKMEKLVHLERIRKEKGLSRRELAEMTGLNQQCIYALEKGATDVNNVKLRTLIVLAKALKVKVVDLLSNDLKKVIR